MRELNALVRAHPFILCVLFLCVQWPFPDQRFPSSRDLPFSIRAAVWVGLCLLLCAPLHEQRSRRPSRTRKPVLHTLKQESRFVNSLSRCCGGGGEGGGSRRRSGSGHVGWQAQPAQSHDACEPREPQTTGINGVCVQPAGLGDEASHAAQRFDYWGSPVGLGPRLGVGGAVASGETGIGDVLA